MPQNPPQSPEEQFAAISAVASKLTTVLEAIEAEETDEALAELSEEPSDESADTTGPERKSPRRRVSRKEAREKLKSRVESIPGFDRHSRKCQICNHPNMEELEEEFINWASTHWIKKAFHLRDESAIYRHARAARLGALRRENLSMVVEKVLQEVDHLDAPTVAEVLRGVRILARLNSRGQWVFAPTSQNPNRQTLQELESPATDTKQTPEVISNRQN